MGKQSVRLAASQPPQYHDRSSTAAIMWTVTLCLLPAAGWGVYVFGVRALVVLVTSILAAVVCEGVAAKLLGRTTLSDGSAVLTGLLIGMSMSAAVPLFIPVVASSFAMLVVKWTFGGLGANWMNPALAGRVFVFFSWTGSMTNWVFPRTLPAVDGLSGATPLGLVKAARGVIPIGEPLSVLRQVGYPVSDLDAGVTGWLNTRVLDSFGVNLPGGYVDLFVGNTGGSIGEISALLLLLGTVVLFSRRIITWQIPFAFFFSFAILTRAFGGDGLWSGDVLFAVFTGGFILAVFFMATDTVTSPLTSVGMLIYGAGAGLLTFVLRAYGQFPESAALAIILMNIAVPLIDRWTQPRRFGLSRRRRRAGPPAPEGVTRA